MAIQWILEVRRILVGSCVLSVVEVLAAGLVVGILCTAGDSRHPSLLVISWAAEFVGSSWYAGKPLTPTQEGSTCRSSFAVVIQCSAELPPVDVAGSRGLTVGFWSRHAASSLQLVFTHRRSLKLPPSRFLQRIVTKLLADPALFSGRDPLRFFFIQDGTKHVDMDSVLAKHPNITSNLQQTERILAETAKVSSNSKPVVDHVLPSSSKTSDESRIYKLGGLYLPY
ncbi:hypothetical protein FNV43_RR07328 [Rhamnella rubrinervis]|uniref:Uncharacterized protein n=1 Tax=Rhamnella rubrinervis TaxID=2594499 RepID=A0A8K0HFM5_9ROSA|nr:hypothetical protein FNV43_RR07328 [Rhamnella rubrinervis]